MGNDYFYMIYPTKVYKDFYPTKQQILDVLDVMEQHEFITIDDLERCTRFVNNWEWDVDGFLIGGASLQADSFVRIARTSAL